MRQQSANEQRASIPGDRLAGCELLHVNTAKYYVGEVFFGVAVEPAAVLAQVQMAVVPAIGRDIGGYVKPTTPEISNEDAPPRESAKRGGETAGEYVLLMAVNNVGLEQFRKD